MRRDASLSIQSESGKMRTRITPNMDTFYAVREKTPLNKTQAIAKSMNMDIWVASTLNQLFIRDSYTQVKFS